MATDTGNERIPLLIPYDDDDGEDNSSIRYYHNRMLALSLCFILLIVLPIGRTLYNTAILDIQEQIICHRIYGHGNEVSACKDAQVQSELSLIRGWNNSFELLVSLIASVPYGAIADNCGRKRVFRLSMLGLTLNAAFSALICAMPEVFHPRVIWLGNLLLFIGGGDAIFRAMVYTIVADVTDEAERATAFVYLGAATMTGSMIANPIVFFAMKRGSWFSVVMGLSALTTAILFAFGMPETRFHNSYKTFTENQTAATSYDITPQGGAIGVITQTFRSIRLLFWEHKLVGLLLISLALDFFGRSVVLQLLQYASRRYNMPFSEANLLHSVRALTSVALLLVVLPWTSQVLIEKIGLSAREKDLRLAQGSAFLAAAGTLLQGLAETKMTLVRGIILAGMGGGYTFVVRALMTSLVGGREIGLMYTSISSVGTLVSLVSGPVYAGLYTVGLGWGDEWSGLPFIFAGLVMVAVAVLVGAMRGSAVIHEWEEYEDESGETTPSSVWIRT